MGGSVPFSDLPGENEGFLKSFKSTGGKYFYFGLVLIFVFLFVIYLGPLEGGTGLIFQGKDAQKTLALTSDSTISPMASVSAASDSLDVIATFEGDENANNAASFEYREVGGESFTAGGEMSRDGSSKKWSGKISDLKPETQYEVKVTFSDPDGIEEKVAEIPQEEAPASVAPAENIPAESSPLPSPEQPSPEASPVPFDVEESTDGATQQSSSSSLFDVYAQGSTTTTTTMTITVNAATVSGVRINVGDSWQSRVNANPDGTTFVIAAGTHSGQSVVPKNGQKFYCEPGAVMSATGQEYAFRGGASNVVINGCEIRNYNSPAQRAAVDPCNGGGSNWLIEDNDIIMNHAAAVYASSGNRVINNRMNDNGQLGAKACGNNGLFEGNEIARNNVVCRVQGAKGNAGSRGCYAEGWEAGGSKFVHTDGLVVRNNNVHHNMGPGLWTDIDNINVTYENNYSHDNAGIGLFHEISQAATIRNNRVEFNGPSTGWAYGAQILISTSRDANVYGNNITVRCANSSQTGCDGIMVIQQNRGSGVRGVHEGRNNNVHDNTITLMSGGEWAAGAVSDYNSGAFLSANNRFNSNRYFVPSTGGNYWAYGGGLSWNGFKSAGQEANGTLSTGTAPSTPPPPPPPPAPVVSPSPSPSRAPSPSPSPSRAPSPSPVASPVPSPSPVNLTLTRFGDWGYTTSGSTSYVDLRVFDSSNNQVSSRRESITPYCAYADSGAGATSCNTPTLPGGTYRVEAQATYTNSTVKSAVHSVTVTAPASPIPTPVPTPSPTPTPKATPSPAPECKIIDALWNKVEIVQGDVAGLTVNVSPECAGKLVSLQVLEYDSIAEGLGDDPVSVNVGTVNIVNNKATANWTGEYQQDGALGIFDPPEYYFNAQIVGTAAKVRSKDPLLTVFKRIMPTPSPTPVASAGVSPSPVASPLAPDASLVAGYSFDEGSGSRTGDSSGRGNTGTISGATWTEGKYGKALNFDGAGDLVSIGPNASLSLGTQYTVSAWIKPDVISDNRGIFGGNFVPDLQLYITGNGESSGRAYRARTSEWPNFDIFGNTGRITAGAWQHVAFTVSGTNLALYYNGQLDASGTIPQANTASGSSNSVIGSSGMSWAPFWFDGAIDDVRVYNRVLSAEEIGQVMQTSLGAGSILPLPQGTWRGEYFNNRNLSGSPILTRDDPVINFKWGWGSPDATVSVNNFSVRWLRQLQIDRAGTYTFSFRHDDGMRAWIDNVLVLDVWRDGRARTETRPIQLSAGAHEIRVEHYENGGTAAAGVSWVFSQ